MKIKCLLGCILCLPNPWELTLLPFPSPSCKYHSQYIQASKLKHSLKGGGRKESKSGVSSRSWALAEGEEKTGSGRQAAPFLCTESQSWTHPLATAKEPCAWAQVGPSPSGWMQLKHRAWMKTFIAVCCFCWPVAMANICRWLGQILTLKYLRLW